MLFRSLAGVRRFPRMFGQQGRGLWAETGVQEVRFVGFHAAKIGHFFRNVVAVLSGTAALSFRIGGTRQRFRRFFTLFSLAQDLTFPSTKPPGVAAPTK